MSKKSVVHDGGNLGDWFKWIISISILTVTFFVHYQYRMTHFNYVIIGWLLAFLVMALVLSLTKQGKSFKEFARESYVEMRKVVWPTRKEAVQTSFIVIGVVLVMGLFLWLMDSGFLWAVGVISGQKG